MTTKTATLIFIHQQW